MTEKLVKRFIAGALCPKCQALDRVVVYRRDHQDFAECVACGYAYEPANPRKADEKNRPSPKTEKIVFLKRKMDTSTMKSS